MNQRIQARIQQARLQKAHAQQRRPLPSRDPQSRPQPHLCPEHAAEQAAANPQPAPQKPGPKTPEGKQRSRMNAYIHGLTGNLLVVDPDQQPVYDALSYDFHLRYRPADNVERNLLQVIIDTVWRLHTCAAVENNIYSAGILDRIKRAQSNPAGSTQDEPVTAAFARVGAWLNYGDTFEKLGRYETRLQRNLSRMLQELATIQSQRPAPPTPEELAALAPATLFKTERPLDSAPPAPSSQTSQSEPLPFDEDSFRKIDKFNREMSEMTPMIYGHPDDPNRTLPLAYDKISAEMAQW